MDASQLTFLKEYNTIVGCCPTPIGPTGPQGRSGFSTNTGATGPTGEIGGPGISTGRILYLDTSGIASEYNKGTLLTIPDTGAQTNILSGIHNVDEYLLATFTSQSGATDSTIITGGLWSTNLYAVASDDTSVTFYTKIYYVDSLENETLIVAGNIASSVQVYSTPYIISNVLYVPDTVLPDLTYRYRVKIFVNFAGNSEITIYCRDSTNSYIHTTLAANSSTGPTGPIGTTLIQSGFTGALTGAVGSIVLGNGSGNATLISRTSITTLVACRLWALASCEFQITSNQGRTVSFYLIVDSETSNTFTVSWTNGNVNDTRVLTMNHRTASIAAGTYNVTLYGYGSDATVATALFCNIFAMGNLI